MTFAPNDTTKIKLSFETYHDNRTADRGNPSIRDRHARQSDDAVRAGRRPDQVLRQPDPEPRARRREHRDGLHRARLRERPDGEERHARRRLQEVLSERLSRAARSIPRPDIVQSVGLQPPDQPAERLRPDRLHLQRTPPGRCFTRSGSARSSVISPASTFATPGSFRTATIALPDNAFNPTYFGPVNFIHHSAAVNADGVTHADSNSKYNANIQSAYVRDTIDVTRWLQLIGGLRFDRFDLSALDQNTNINRQRIDNLVSPQAAVIIKPRDNLSFYGVYAISYLPASGDQFSALDPRHGDSRSAEIREQGGRRQMEHPAAPDLHRGGVPARPHRHSAERPDQSRLLPC